MQLINKNEGVFLKTDEEILSAFCEQAIAHASTCLHTPGAQQPTRASPVLAGYSWREPQASVVMESCGVLDSRGYGETDIHRSVR